MKEDIVQMQQSSKTPCLHEIVQSDCWLRWALSSDSNSHLGRNLSRSEDGDEILIQPISDAASQLGKEAVFFVNDDSASGLLGQTGKTPKE
jgi:hypothetical protein